MLLDDCTWFIAQKEVSWVAEYWFAVVHCRSPSHAAGGHRICFHFDIILFTDSFNDNHSASHAIWLILRYILSLFNDAYSTAFVI
jgi:hypothetical protein